MENWKPIEGYEGHYEVSDQGRVRSLDRYVDNGKGSKMFVKGVCPRATRINPVTGYIVVDLRMDGKKKTYQVHRLVAKTFIHCNDPSLDVLHGPSKKLDNSVKNLSWGTKSQNNLDKNRDGTDHQRNKICCLRGHVLELPNLRSADWKKGRRVCLACDRAKASLSSRKKQKGIKFSYEDFVKLSHQKYQIIML